MGRPSRRVTPSQVTDGGDVGGGGNVGKGVVVDIMGRNQKKKKKKTNIQLPLCFCSLLQ